MGQVKNHRLHFWLVAGNVVINQDDNIHSIPQNGLIATDDRNLGEYQLGKAQQVLQANCAKVLGEAPQFVDVVLINFTYLGHMTEAEFHKRPKDLAVRERSAEVLDLTQELEGRG